MKSLYLTMTQFFFFLQVENYYLLFVYIRFYHSGSVNGTRNLVARCSSGAVLSLSFFAVRV